MTRALRSLRSSPASRAPRVDVHLGEGDLERALRDDARAGLTATPKRIPSKWFYDDHGSELFDEITRLDEYYPTRREREILTTHAAGIVKASGADTLVELGSGTSEKTRLLLDAMAARGVLRRFVPFDVSEGTLRVAAVAVATEYPWIDVHAVVGDFERHLGAIPREGLRLVAFLGGTIGNLTPAERASFLGEVAAGMRRGDSLLIGMDLVKDVHRLEAAYNDARGVTAAFNRNVLHVLNRRLGADFDPDRFAHVAFFDRENEWIEMRLRSLGSQRVRVPAIDLEVSFERGEEMRTEISAKFRRERAEEEIASAGLRPAGWWTDRGEDFALALATPR